MKNLLLRTATGILFVIILVLLTIWNPFSAGALFLIISVIAWFEFCKMFDKNELAPEFATGLIFGAGGYLVIFLAANSFIPDKFLAVLAPMFFLALIPALFRNAKNPAANAALTALGMIYVFAPFALANILVNIGDGETGFNPWYLIGILILIWVNDVFAYLGGLSLGRHKLFERLSPNKTWEGTITGIFFAVVASYPVSIYIQGLSLVHWAILAALVSVFGIFGDLFESMIKRSNNIKDSGSILPGHGGVLDRFDAFIFALPVATAYILLVG